MVSGITDRYIVFGYLPFDNHRDVYTSMMNTRDGEGLSELFARLDDMVGKSERGELAVSSFLTPREQHYAQKYLERMGAHLISFGGYADAERQRIYILPDYMEGVDSSADFEDYGFSCEIATLEINGSGYRNLTHRDYLGSLLGLGLERSVIGDIVVLDEKGRQAVVFCESRISRFIEEMLEKVANDKVKVRQIEISENFLPKRKFAPISDTIASPRLDCIVAALCSLSRAKAAETITGGLVELDFEREERPDRVVSAPAQISVRGFGKFRIHSTGEQTKKGRYRLSADKYI